MILKLRDGTISVSDNRCPEDINNAKIMYNFELGTNHLLPILYIEGNTYSGDTLSIPFKYDKDIIDIKVDLVDGLGTVIKSYNNTFNLYNTFTIGTKEHIDIYKELEKAYARIKELEEKGDVI